MKKKILLSIVVLTMVLFAGCGASNASSDENQATTPKPSVSKEVLSYLNSHSDEEIVWDEERWDKFQENMSLVLLFSGDEYDVYVHPYTNVLYALHLDITATAGSAFFEPLLNPDGTPMVYGRDIEY